MLPTLCTHLIVQIRFFPYSNRALSYARVLPSLDVRCVTYCYVDENPKTAAERTQVPYFL